MKNKCLEWYHNDFKTQKIFQDMSNTVEDSKWHREINVGTHTDMVVSQFISRCPTTWSKYHVMGFLMCVFHDVGKPLSEITKHSEDRGYYRAYHGHELLSSRMFEDYIYAHHYIQDRFELSKIDIYGITWMIEHHVPWSTKNDKKRIRYAKTINRILNNQYDIFIDCLLSDSYGRIADKSNDKLCDAESWASDFRELCEEHIFKSTPEFSSKLLYVPIGPSGSGKSTYYEKYYSHIQLYSLDEYRVQWYPADSYIESFQLACEDKEFMNKAHAKFMTMIKGGKSIYVDEMNLSVKRRNFVIMEARKKGYSIIGITLPLCMSKLGVQQSNRTDKIMTPELYNSMYRSVQQPSFGEFDEIVIR